MVLSPIDGTETETLLSAAASAARVTAPVTVPVSWAITAAGTAASDRSTATIWRRRADRLSRIPDFLCGIFCAVEGGGKHSTTEGRPAPTEALLTQDRLARGGRRGETSGRKATGEGCNGVKIEGEPAAEAGAKARDAGPAGTVGRQRREEPQEARSQGRVGATTEQEGPGRQIAANHPTTPPSAAISAAIIPTGTTPSDAIRATSPMTVTTGASSPSRSATSAIVASVARATR